MNKIEFADSFTKELFKSPFGSLPKRELEILILSHAIEYGLLSNEAAVNAV